MSSFVKASGGITPNSADPNAYYGCQQNCYQSCGC